MPNNRLKPLWRRLRMLPVGTRLMLLIALFAGTGVVVGCILIFTSGFFPGATIALSSLTGGLILMFVVGVLLMGWWE